MNWAAAARVRRDCDAIMNSALLPVPAPSPPAFHRSVTMGDLEEGGESGTMRRRASALIVAYFVLGVAYYSLLASPSKYAFVDALYFCVVTITTVGYGDLNTRYHDTASTQDMMFTSFFVLLGVGLVGTALGVVMAYVLDREDALAASFAAGDDGDGRAGKPGKTRLLGLRMSEAQSKVALSTVVIIALLFVGTLAFALLEGTDVATAFYWTCVSVTTVGYGDVAPRTNAGKYFCCAFLLVGTVLMAKALSDVADLPLELRRRRMERAVLDQYGDDLDPEEFAEILRSFHSLGLTTDADGSCSKTEFVLSMLLKLDKVNRRDVRRCVDVFESLDLDRSGRLDAADIRRASAVSPVC